MSLDSDNQESNFVYMVYPGEYVYTKSPIYKIGMTQKSMIKRLQGYIKNTAIILCIEVVHITCIDMEKILIAGFNENFKLVRGNEYFEGNKNEMMKLFQWLVLLHDVLTINPNNDEHYNVDYEGSDNENSFSYYDMENPIIEDMNIETVETTISDNIKTISMTPTNLDKYNEYINLITNNPPTWHTSGKIVTGESLYQLYRTINGSAGRSQFGQYLTSKFPGIYRKNAQPIFKNGKKYPSYTII